MEENEVSKDEFKKVYFEHLSGGWTKEYWDKCYEQEEGGKYFVFKSETVEQNRMMMVSGRGKHRMVFVTEDVEDDFFWYPGKEKE